MNANSPILPEPHISNQDARRYGTLPLGEIRSQLSPEDFQIFMDTVGSIEIPLGWSVDDRDFCEPSFDAPRLIQSYAPRPVAAIRFPAPVHVALRNPQTGEVCPLELADTTLLVMMIHCGWTFAQESEGQG